MLTIDHTHPAIRPEDLFGPPARPGAGHPDGPANRALRDTLARLLLRLAAQDWRAGAGIGPLIDRLRAAIDAAEARQRHVAVPAHPLLESWLPRAGGGSFCELALLVESLAAAPEAERASWGRRLYLRFGTLVAEEMVRLAEHEDALAPVLRGMLGEDGLRAVTLRMMAAIPPSRVQAFLVLSLPAMDPAMREAFLAAALAAAEDDTAAAVIEGSAQISLAA